MKTIFIPIQGRPQARSILRTDIFETLKADKEVRTVIFVPWFKLDEYKKEFYGDNIVFEGVKDLPTFLSGVDAFFGRLSLSYIDSPTARFLRKQWMLLEKKERFRYLVSMFFLLLFGNIKILRSLIRFFDLKLVKDNGFSDYFEKYKPDLVFSPLIQSETDRSFLRHAKTRGVRTVGMINSWDNITLSKYSFRINPDKMIVHNEIIKKEAMNYLDMKPENIFISGMPHFDHYIKSKRCSREEFCKRLDIDSKKRIILFASRGSLNRPTEHQIFSMLNKAMIEGKLNKEVVIIFRRHPMDKTAMPNIKYSNVIFDDSKTVFQGKKGQNYSEILKEDMEHLADSIYHSDVTVNFCSTMSIDAAAFDKPVISIAFDGWENKPFHESLARLFKPSHAHSQSIVKSGGVKIVYSFDEFIDAMNAYFENPSLDSEGRKRIVDEQCWKLDGMSGARIGKYLLSLIKK